jgi:hypothetical protein
MATWASPNEDGHFKIFWDGDFAIKSCRAFNRNTQAGNCVISYSCAKN